MDPDAAWNLLVDAIISKDCEEARSIASSLLEWLERGGFPPKISLQRVTIEWQLLLCKRVCRSVISATNTGGKLLAMERPHWSFSAINQFLRCPLQYYFERVLRLPRLTVSSGLVFGSSVHHALAIYHNALQKNTSVTIDELKIGIREIWAKEGAMKKIEFKSGELLEGSVEQAITLIELYVREPQPTDIVCVEKRMTVPLQNSDGDILEKPLIAVADLISRASNEILITEFKTAAKAYSEFEVDSSLQPSCYVNASLELFGEIANVEFAILVKTKTPKIQRLRTIRDAKDLGRLGDLVETIEHSVANQNYYPIESTMNCSSCSYRKECRSWKPKRSASKEMKLVPLNGVHACWPN